MSYQIVISGHSEGLHNDQVVGVAVDAVKALKAAGHTDVSLSGWTSDGEGSVQLVDALVPGDEPTNATEATSTATETVAETVVAPTDSPTETASETPSAEA